MDRLIQNQSSTKSVEGAAGDLQACSLSSLERDTNISNIFMHDSWEVGKGALILITNVHIHSPVVELPESDPVHNWLKINRNGALNLSQTLLLLRLLHLN